jgi:ribosomal protein S18 acetylase RimI-like enzyme
LCYHPFKDKNINISKIKYKTKTATTKEIYSHLKECNDYFCPQLDKRVNVEEYSKKLFENSVTFEAWTNKIIIGLIAAYFNDKINNVGYITTVSLISRYTGSGIASELMDICINYAKQNYFKAINLEVHKDNTKAINLYHKFGFLDYGNKDEFILMKLTGF